MTRQSAAKRRVVVIGNGMVGHRFCERIAELDGENSLALTVFADEPRVAYDRVHLSEFFSGRGAEDLALTSRGWYLEQGFEVQLGQEITSIDLEQRCVGTAAGMRTSYDQLVLATGSRPFVPPIPGVDLPGVFVYRTIDDLAAIRAHAEGSRCGAVIGGGLLGLEAAKALVDLGLDTHVIEFADRLMPRQVDSAGGDILRQQIQALGVHVHVGTGTQAILGDRQVGSLQLDNGQALEVGLVIVSAGIRPRDDLARACGLVLGERGGIQVDDALTTSDANVSAIGECALHAGVVHGLVAPGYEMADTLAERLVSDSGARFRGADAATQLKVMGVAVGSFGDCFGERAEHTRSLVVEDPVGGTYQKLVVDASGERLLGGILVGDTQAFPLLASLARKGERLPMPPIELLTGSRGSAISGPDVPLCSCNDVSTSEIVAAIDDGAVDLASIKSCTRAGTGCGGCVPVVSKLLEAELLKRGSAIDRSLCEHFRFTRQELFMIVKTLRIESFDALLDSHGKGDGCEVCRPAVASILASTWNELLPRHASIQDTNDRFLANIQRGGSYSVIPRVPGGEITPEGLIVLGEVARKYDLYCKITGGQRVDLLGARADQLPAIWQELIDAGFESGHAYGKALRTVKSCVGSSWCRYGVQDSTAFAIRLEERYRGIRAPHKLKSAVSGCIRECAEAKSKDFGIIATEKGWNVYLGGNGGAHPRHGDLVATDLDDDAVIRLLDCFIMFYIQTAKPLQRTARWLEELDGGLETLKKVLLEDSLGLCDQLERDMQLLVDSYRCEWKAVVEDPDLRARFENTASSEAIDRGEEAAPFLRVRGQRQPEPWGDETSALPQLSETSEQQWEWQPLAQVDQVPRDAGYAVRYGGTQIAIYHFARRGEWFATQNTCPHRQEAVLALGLLGDQGGEPKVACPLHKKTFSLETGKGLSDPAYSIATFPVRIEGNQLQVKLPPADALLAAVCSKAGRCHS